MASVLSTRDLSTDSNTDYDTLEEYILQTSRKKERKRRKDEGEMAEEVPTTVRLEEWQESEVGSIRRKLSTSSSNVLNRAYIYGLERLREEVPDVEKAATLGARIQDLIKHDVTDIDRYGTFHEKYKGVECNIETSPQGSISEDTTSVRVFGSILQEVTDTFKRDLHCNGSIHRVIIGMGLRESNNIGRVSHEFADTMLESMKEEVPRYHFELEGLVDRYTRWSMQDWREQGIDKQTYEELKEIVKIMDTEHKDGVQDRVEEIGEFVVDEE